MKLKVVEVTFYDVENGAGWHDFSPKSLKDIAPLKASGYLVHRDEQWVVLAFTYNPSARDWCGSFSIPAGMVKNIRILKVSEA